MKWTEEKSFTLGGNTFFSCSDLQDIYSETPEDVFRIVKSRAMLETLQERLAHLHSGNIVELGIFKGGSTVWLNEMLKPKKLVAFEFGKEPRVPLEDYIDRNGIRSKVRVFYGVNQKSVNVLRNILDAEFKNEALDIVIDDASHLLEETRISFSVLFSRLRPGGIFVLEDWGWGHAIYEDGQPVSPQLVDQWPLTTLLMEVLMASASAEGAVENIFIDGKMAFIQRGNAELDPNEFDISSIVRVAKGFRFRNGFEKTDGDA
jgi:predicted O-methyltransferase YrrM